MRIAERMWHACIPAIGFMAPLCSFGQQPEAELAEIVVMGTALPRSSHDTPLAATTLDENLLAKLTSSSQADILNSVPTIKAEGGGGEVAANVFIKGLPSSGQYQFTPLEYDGIPVFSSFGLNSSAYDVFYRNDLGVERLEFVRGGVSNLFARARWRVSSTTSLEPAPPYLKADCSWSSRRKTAPARTLPRVDRSAA